MLSILVKLFIKNPEAVTDPDVRRAYGQLCGGMGIGLNILLFAAKYFAGVISGSIAITADAFNNLSDAGSSVISLAGFSLAGKKPDADHPFGHGRIEYLSGLAVAMVIVLMGFELAKDSVAKIMAPEELSAGLLPAAILLGSIAVKFYMYLYNRAIGRRIGSAAMLATASDSLSDTVSTAVVLISMLIAHFSGVNIDGWAGLLVACFILYTGFCAGRDTLQPLLGKAPEPELVEKIEEIVMSHEEICGMHDLIVHDYGPGRMVISLHAEVDGAGDIFELHDAIDNIERELKDSLYCLATVHMDPIETANEDVTRLRCAVEELLKAYDERISIHDFRIVPGPSHTNLIFDAVIPFDLKLSDSEMARKIEDTVSSALPGHFAVVDIDRSYI